jgi:ribonucleoside-diphosphate reductase alpha chain
VLAAEAPAAVARDTADARLGEVVGWLTGDGHFTNHAGDARTAVLSFYGRDKREAGPRLLDSARALVGRDLDLNLVEARDLVYVRSQRLRAVLAELGVDEGCKQRLPEPVWRGSLDLLSGYLRGLFSADGSVQGSIARGASVRLAANELGLLRDVQQALLRLGIRSVIYANRRGEQVRLMPDAAGELREYACAAQHELVIARGSLRTFADAVGFLIADKSVRLSDLVAGYTRGPYRDSGWATVSELVCEGEAEVFDLSEPSTRHFFAGGLLTHNCGEQPLLPFESCTLGSINLGRFVTEGERPGVDWERLRAVVRDSVRFLDDVIDANHYPLPEIERATKATRKIGLGVMGWADMLIELGIPYDSEAALELAGELAEVLEQESLDASAELAEERGTFPAWDESRWQRAGHRALRNATTTTVAPTGTISIIAGCSSGIEPLYALAYERHVLDGEVLPEVNPAFRRTAEAHGVWSEDLAARLAAHGSADVPGLPADVRAIFATAHDVSIEGHVKMQAAFQRHVHAAVSKTINLRRDATAADVRRAYQLAYDLGCKGITVYRDGSREGQVLRFGAIAEAAVAASQCPECGAPLLVHDRCRMCRSCGWSVCS